MSKVTVGAGGALLLDPKNITIADTATAVSTWSYEAVIGSGYTGGKNVDVGSLEVNEQFGVSVSLNAGGDRLAVGAYGDGGFGNLTLDSGAVYLFSFSDTSFSGGALQGIVGKGYIGGKSVNVGSLEPLDMFGWSVALNASGDRLAVGAVRDNGFGNLTSGSG
ncbi:MAG: hypothetical protein IPH54_22745, partial [Rhodoferax sp.]|nr:hypothetical protein [Rhodoferax sp.]